MASKSDKFSDPASVTLLPGDVQIGAVEIKDDTAVTRANVRAANTVRTPATIVIATQNVDAAGEVMASADLVDIKTAVELIDDIIVPATSSGRTGEINPIPTFHGRAQNEYVNVIDGTYDHYFDMDNMRKFGIQLELDGGAGGTMTAKIYGTLQDDGTAPNLCAPYFDLGLAVFGAANWVNVDVQLIDNVERLALFKYIWLEFVAATGGANDADYTYREKDLY